MSIWTTAICICYKPKKEKGQAEAEADGGMTALVCCLIQYHNDQDIIHVGLRIAMTGDREDEEGYKTIHQDKTRLQDLQTGDVHYIEENRNPTKFNHLYRTWGNDVTTTTDLNKPHPELNRQRNQNTVSYMRL
jgi:hypothetical protein